MHELLEKDRVYAAVDLLFLTVRERRLYLLLSRRENEPCAGYAALPGRMIGLSESAEETAAVLENEMLPGAGAYMEQLYTFSDVHRDARGRVITIAYFALIPYQRLERLLPSTKMRLYEIDTRAEEPVLTDEEGKHLAKSDLAFDHARIIQTCINRLKGKIGYTDISLRLLSDDKRFTMVELEGIFEAVTGQEADKSNFRRFIRSRFEDSGIITALRQTEKQTRGRPALLYRWNREA